jgi:hypothetical protein
MNTHEQLLTDFYQAFTHGDPEGMARCYAPDVSFSDPVFPSLKGERVMAMWRMLGAFPGPRAVSFGGIRADGARGEARWETRYVFPQTGRHVHNIVRARFTFAGGKIATHVDDFDFWRWARMALGPIGWLLGWTPLMRARVRAQAGARLEQAVAAHAKHATPA